MSRLQKIINKSCHWHKHGKHGSRQEIARLQSKNQRRPEKLEPIDLKKADWSRR